MQEKRKIYLDHAATTATDPEVLQQMLPYFSEVFGNGNSQHQEGRSALKAIDRARAQVAEAIGAAPNEIYFTASGTESDNWAIRGAAEALKEKGNHIITTAIEHPAVMNTCKYLEKNGYEVTYLPVDSEGFVSVEDVKNAVRDQTILITIMFANNEVGTIQPIAEIGKFAREKRIYFHTDAVQAAGACPIDVKALGVDMLSLSAHKFYGPKGVGVLYRRNGVKITKFMIGGEQERGLRAGTLNTPGIVGMGAAIEKAVKNMQENNRKAIALRNEFVRAVQAEIPYVRYNGPLDDAKRLPNNASFSFELIEGESILMCLDLEGICVSSGSACSSGSLDPSHVLLAIGIPIEEAHGTIRFTFGAENTKEEIAFVVEKLKETVAKLRAMSPLFKQFEGEKYDV